MLNILFNPKSVAVIGASSNPTKWGNWAAEQLMVDRHFRSIYFVNTRKEVICDRQSLRTIAEIPQPLDVAIVTVPLVSFEETIDQLLEHGTEVIVAITAGFGERDKAGLELEQRVAKKVKDAGAVLIGPNCAGVLDNHSMFRCLPVLCPEREQAPGTIGLISQSGGLITDVHLRLKEVGLNFSRVISIGNCSGVLIKDLIASFEEDPNTKIIALYVENDKAIPYKAIENAKKPIVLMMPHHTPASIRAAKKHTNSTLSGAGLPYVDNVRDFIATIQAVNSNQHGEGERIMIVTDSGGMGIVAAADAEHNFLTVDQPSKQLVETLKTGLRNIPQAVISNPLDLVGIPSGFSTATVNVMRVLQQSSEVDAIMMILFLIEAKLPTEYETGLELANVARTGGKPVVFVCKDLSSPGARALLEENMPVYRDVDTAVHMLEFLCG